MVDDGAHYHKKINAMRQRTKRDKNPDRKKLYQQEKKKYVAALMK